MEISPPPAALPPPPSTPTARVALLMLVVGSTLPPWWPFLVASYIQNSPTYTLVVIHTGVLPAGTNTSAPHVRYEHIPLLELQDRFVRKLQAPADRVAAKFASGKGLSDLKPFYGAVFDDLLPEARYTHWGWVDWDLILGDLNAVLPMPMLWEYEALTFPGTTLGSTASLRDGAGRVARRDGHGPGPQRRSGAALGHRLLRSCSRPAPEILLHHCNRE